MRVLYFQERYCRTTANLDLGDKVSLVYQLIKDVGKNGFFESEVYDYIVSVTSKEKELVHVNATTFPDEFFEVDDEESCNNSSILVQGEWIWSWTSASVMWSEGVRYVIGRVATCEEKLKLKASKSLRSFKWFTVASGPQRVASLMRSMFSPYSGSFSLEVLWELTVMTVVELVSLGKINLIEEDEEIGEFILMYADVLSATQEICIAFIANRELTGELRDICLSMLSDVEGVSVKKFTVSEKALSIDKVILQKRFLTPPIELQGGFWEGWKSMFQSPENLKRAGVDISLYDQVQKKQKPNL
jgi:hypothetical protein